MCLCSFIFAFQCDTRLIQGLSAAQETGSRRICMQDVERSTNKDGSFGNVV